MRNPDARVGAAIAGAMLVGLPIVALFFDPGLPGPADAVTAIFGTGLLAAALRATAKER